MSSEEVEQVYLRKLMPLKLTMEKDYLSGASLGSDCKVVLRTVGQIIIPKGEYDGLLSRELSRGLEVVQHGADVRPGSDSFPFERALAVATGEDRAQACD